MSYTVPYSFVPGTKARAQEVNANFSSILESLEDIDESKVNLDLSNISSAGLDVIKNNSSIRNIGELVFSPIPLTDSGLHLLDGSLIQRNGVYQEFVDYIASKYDGVTSYNRDAFTVVGNLSITNDGVANGFVRGSNYIVTEEFEDLSSAENWGMTFSFNVTTLNDICYLISATSSGNANLQIFLRPNGKMSIGVFADNGATLVFKSDTSATFLTNTIYTCRICFTGTAYKFYIKDLNDEWVLDIQSNLSAAIGTLTKLYLGTGNNGNYNGYLYLKDILLTRNGAEIFSGSKSPNYFTDEVSWQNDVTTYGECGKFVYDSISQTVRLPKIKGLIEYTSSSSQLGELTEAGLPNITGFIDELCMYSSSSPTGAFYETSSDYWRKSGTDQTLYQKDVHFDASYSSSIYGKSSTVQPQTIKYLVYIVVATTAKTDIQIDINNIVTDLNGKLDADLSNLALTNIHNFDGQWSYKHSAINNNAITSVGKYNVDLSTYLPVDQNKYEVIVNIYGSQSHSPNNSYIILSSSLINEAGIDETYGNFTLNSNGNALGAQLVFPVGVNRVLSYRIGGNNFNTLYIRLYGYRRIGTNN